MKDQFIQMNIKKSENKNTTNEYRCFLESNFVGVNSFFVFFLFIQIKITIQEVIKLEDIIYQKVLLGIILPLTVKTFMTKQLILI